MKNQMGNMGFLQHYVMLSIRKCPKSGYELLKELQEKTKNKICISKGTLYPLIDKLEANGIIQVKESGNRSKKIYALTQEGKKTLSTIHKKKEGFKERSKIMRSLFIDYIGTNIEKKIKDIEQLSEKVDLKEAEKILNLCIDKLQKQARCK
ncbi:MAG: PadR family transcriptional regulator [Nanobdellota archaeon]